MQVHDYNSQNQNNIESQSAGNELLNKVRSSETIRVLSKSDIEWLAGILDGDGSFEFRKGKQEKKLHMISITQSIRDVRILYRVKDLLKMGSIKHKSSNICVYRLMHTDGMYYLLNLVNGEIRLKLESFKKACLLYNINFKEPCFIIPKNSAYLAGLVDTDGSVVLNYNNNRIELHIEVKRTLYSLKLDLSKVIEFSNIKVYPFEKRNQKKNKIFYSIRFSFSSNNNMLLLYNYFKKNRLYSDFKFFRVMLIKKFLELRIYKNYPIDSLEYKMFKKFIFKFWSHLNYHKELPIYLSEFR